MADYINTRRNFRERSQVTETIRILLSLFLPSPARERVKIMKFKKKPLLPGGRARTGVKQWDFKWKGVSG
jgi:hypothetical protein